MTTSHSLKEGYRDYLDGASLLESKNNYKSAVNLYFKALTSLVDYVLEQETNRVPSNHSDRFRMTENKFKEIYSVLDALFSTYRDSYTEERGQKHVKKIKDGIRRILRSQKLTDEFELPD